MIMSLKQRKIKFEPRILFFLLYKPTNYDVFDDFPKISDHFRRFQKIFTEGCTNVSEHFPRISDEDCRRYPREIRRFFDLISIYFGSFRLEHGKLCKLIGQK